MVIYRLSESPSESAHPALIRPADGDKVTGIPKKIFSPDSYGDSSLWRYWSPDAAENVATRGHIFIMNQSCIDLKVRPNERTANLTFRPIYRDIPDIKWTKVPPWFVGQVGDSSKVVLNL